MVSVAEPATAPVFIALLYVNLNVVHVGSRTTGRRRNCDGRTRGVSAAMDLVLDELEGTTGVSLHAATFIVCRLDVAHTFLGLQAPPYLAEAAKYVLPRRERSVFEHGVTWRSKIRTELLYDKRAEILGALAKLPDARDDDGELRSVSALLAGLTDGATNNDGRLAESAGLAEAAALVADGALRVECRVRGSVNVARALDLVIPGAQPRRYYPATFERVIRDEHTHRLLGGFLSQFNLTAGPASAAAIAQLQAAGQSGSRLLQLLGFRELELLVAADRDAYRALGLSAARRRELRRALHLSGVHGLGGPVLSPLVVTHDDLAEIRRRDEGEQDEWQHRRTAWRRSWQLQPPAWGMLADSQ